jgi:hypothetical protein
MPYIGRLDAFRERASVANPTVRDHLGTLALNLRHAAEAADALRQDQDLIHAMGGDLMRADVLKLERDAIAFRHDFGDARRALGRARQAARVAIDAAQAARRGRG